MERAAVPILAFGPPAEGAPKVPMELPQAKRDCVRPRRPPSK